MREIGKSFVSLATKARFPTPLEKIAEQLESEMVYVAREEKARPGDAPPPLDGVRESMRSQPRALGEIPLKPGDDVTGGHYARKQLACSAAVIAWSHRQRYLTGVRLARRFAGKRIVDYGCGDGTLLSLLADGENSPSLAVGAEIDPQVVADCKRRLGGRQALHFLRVNELDAPEHAAAYDGAICMEVLEHVVNPELVLDRLGRLLKPGGTLIVSVPVETGVALLLKQAVRTVAGWMRIGDYPGTGSYTLRELWRSLHAGENQHIPRMEHQGTYGFSYDHKGFNWKLVRRMVRARFLMEEELVSPIGVLPAFLGSQVWFVARKRIEVG